MRRQDTDLARHTYYVRAFKPGRIVINQTEYHDSVIITPAKVISEWKVPTIAALTKETLAVMLSLQPDVLLLGTGAQHHFIDPGIYADLVHHGIGVEVMSTHAASRTFNALLLDGRSVAAALIIS